jgi:hypothetical protein
MGIIERLTSVASPLVDQDDFLIFEFDTGRVKINGNEDRIVVEYGENVVGWVDENVATEDDIENMNSWGNEEYDSFNVSASGGNLAYEDINARIECLVNGAPQPENFIVTVDLPDDVIEYVTGVAEESGKTFEEVLQGILVKSLEELNAKTTTS